MYRVASRTALRMAWQAKHDVCASRPGQANHEKPHANNAKQKNEQCQQIYSLCSYAMERCDCRGDTVDGCPEISRLPAGRQKNHGNFKPSVRQSSTEMKKPELNSIRHRMRCTISFILHWRIVDDFSVRPFAVGLNHGSVVVSAPQNVDRFFMRPFAALALWQIWKSA